MFVKLGVDVRQLVPIARRTDDRLDTAGVTVIEQFRTLLHTMPFDPAELNADDQQALLNLFLAARQSQSSGGGLSCPGPSFGLTG